jgi:tetratricopeptide (TPR) repeat protein
MLVDIYCKLKEYESAMEECQTILNINPDDDEIKALMISLIHPSESPESASADKPATDHESSIEAGRPATADESATEDESATVNESADSVPATDPESSIEAGRPVYEIPEENNDSELDVELPQTIIPVPEGPVNSELQEFRKIMATESREKPLEEEEQKDDNADGILDDSASADKSATADLPAEAGESVPMDKSATADKPAQAGEPEDTPKDVDGPEPDEERDKKIVISMPTNTMADIFISQGHYNKAMDIYNEILSSDPDNKKIAQRREELKMLIKISDKK